MPEPAGSPSDPSPTSSQFFDAKAITAQLASAQSVEEGTLNSSEQIADNTRGLFDFVKDDISKSIEKISSGAKVSREDLVIKENRTAKVFGNIVSTITSVDKVLKGINNATSKFFDVVFKSILTIGVTLSLAYFAIKIGLEKLVQQTSSGLATLIAIPRLLAPIGALLGIVGGLGVSVGRSLPFFQKFAVTLANIDDAGQTIGQFLKNPLIKVTAIDKVLLRLTQFGRFIKGVFPVISGIGKVAGAVFSVVGRLASIVGKFFFPLTVAVSLIQGVADFLRGGGQGGIGKLFLDIGDRLVKNLTFGFVSLRGIIDVLDAIFTQVRILASYLSFGLLGDRDEIRAGRSVRAFENQRDRVFNELTALGLGRDAANRVLESADTVNVSDLPAGAIRDKLVESGIQDELDELRDRRREAAERNRGNQEVLRLIGETSKMIAMTNANIDKVNSGRASDGVRDAGGGVSSPPSRPAFSPSFGAGL